MRVLLINPSYPLEEFPRLLVTLPYLAATLREAGHEVEILDLLLAGTTPEKIERRMERFRPELVGITSVTLNHHSARFIAEVVRKCDEQVPIAMGGPHVSFEIEGSFRDLPALDFIVSGEGDLETYTFNTGVAQHRFCRHCGIKSFYVPRSHPDGISINVNCLDPGTAASITVTDFDGQHWEQNIHTLSPISD